MSRIRPRPVQGMGKRLRMGEQSGGIAQLAMAEEEPERRRVASEPSISTDTTEEDGNSSEDTSGTSTSSAATLALASMQELIPGLPQEIGTWIVARMPRGVYPHMRQVCKCWNEILRPNSIYRIRQELRLVEDWVFMGTATATPAGQSIMVWKVLDPNLMQWYELPNVPRDSVFSSCDRECMVAGRQLLVVGRTMTTCFGMCPIIYLYDSDFKLWSVAKSMHEERCLFASASYGKYAYVAGGTSGAMPTNIRRSAERFNSETGEWELLENMHFPRRECSGFVMDKCFYVIGGMTQNQAGELVALSSGEFYDPETRKWTLVQGMWPECVPHANLGQYSPPLVAVLNDQLFALNASCGELMSYNKGTMQWSTLGKVPSRAVTSDGWGLGFRSLGTELWVIGGMGAENRHVPFIDACTPKEGDPQWRRVTTTWNGFVANCAVMKS